MTWIALVLAGVATVVLAAVAASGIGPLTSLRRSAGRLKELGEEAEDLRRGLDRLQARRRDVD